MATEYLHPSEELRGVLQQTTKRKLLYTVAMLPIEEEVTLVNCLRKAKLISSAEEHECGAEMPMSYRLAGCIQEVLRTVYNCYRCTPRKHRCREGSEATLRQSRFEYSAEVRRNRLSV
jgi:hypothetical protein